MTEPLSPAPSSLHLHSPALGPWFRNVATQLAAAGPELAITLPTGIHWQPPATGTLSYFVSTPERPRQLAGLRDATGEQAFSDNRFIALFRLLPEVEERLAALSRILPSLAGEGAAGSGRTRPRIRSFALEVTPSGDLDWAFVSSLLYHGFSWPMDLQDGDTPDAERAAHVGLRVDGDGLTNGASPMVDLRGPGRVSEQLLELVNVGAHTSRLWVFDDRGHPVDPGAVATWWHFLTTQGYSNLWAQTLQGGDQRIAALAPEATDRLTMHLVNAHGGPLTDSALARLELSNTTGEGPVRVRGELDEAAHIAFTPEPEIDDLPVARVAIQPDGRLAATASLWPSGAIDGGDSPVLTRDFARVAVVSIEHHLVGQTRHADSVPAPAQRRADDQQRASTRVRVARAQRDALRTTLDDATTALLTVFEHGLGDARLVTSVLDPDSGSRSLSLLDTPVPAWDARPTIEVRALVGGGASGPVARDQRVLVTLTFTDGESLADAWVRVWTQGFDHEKAEHIHLEGGAGRVDATGRVRLVAVLPDGAVSPDALMGLDALVVTAAGTRLFTDLRFERPAPVGGSSVNISADGVSVLVCDTGVVAPTPIIDGVLPSGAVLVAHPDTDTPALVDPTTISATSWVDQTVIRQLTASSTVRLTEPAFRGQPDGQLPENFAASGAAVTRQNRAIDWSAGAPQPGMERLETVAASVSDTNAWAAIGSSPALAVSHESSHHCHGHPGCPATEDAHGTGVYLAGPAALEVAEYVRDRTAGDTSALATLADTPIPLIPEPVGAGVWAAGLRTEAAGVALEININDLFGGDPYPFSGTWSDKRSALTGISLPESPANPLQVERAVDRRVLTAAYGAREAATSLIAALRRAENFIYIETPAIDIGRGFGITDDQLDLGTALLDRLTERPSLHIVFCVPVVLGRSTPRPLQRVRDVVTGDALAAFASNDRVAHFSPAGGPRRALELHSTSVVIDDVYALTGTTHLWRRGLSFDASYAVSVTDEQYHDDRPQEIADFRRQLIAGRLGLATNQVPEDPSELVAAIRLLAKRGGHGRLATKRLLRPRPEGEFDPTALTTVDLWNSDGSAPSDFNLAAWILSLAALSSWLNPAG